MPSKVVFSSDGTFFEGVKIAQDFYRGILRADIVGTHLSGADLNSAEVLYRDYCAVTQWSMPGEITGISRGTDTRMVRGREVATDCLVVTFSDGSRTNFSVSRACSAIANRGHT